MIIEAIGRSDFFSVFMTGCLMFYIASRMIRADWTSAEANRMRRIVAYTFYGFGVILLIASLFRLPGCVGKRDQPGVEQKQIEQGKPESLGQPKMADDQK